jgi:hypothetical protein
LFGVNGNEPMVGGYRADYSALTNEQIQAPTPDDKMLNSGDWRSVNRRNN